MTTIDIDRDAAHDAAQNELNKPIYPRSSLTQQFLDWIDELLYRLAYEGSTVPGGWFTISVLAILVVVAVLVAVRMARRAIAPTATRTRCSAAPSSAPPNTARPPTGMPRKKTGPQPSGTGCERWPGTWRRPAH